MRTGSEPPGLQKSAGDRTVRLEYLVPQLTGSFGLGSQPGFWLPGGENTGDLDRIGPINIGIVHEQSPWTTHNGLRFAVEALSGGIVNADRLRVC